MDEVRAPSIDKLQYCYESLGKKFKRSGGAGDSGGCNRGGIEEAKDQFQKYVHNHDFAGLGMTKDVLDFEKSFLKHLKTSIESQK